MCHNDNLRARYSLMGAHVIPVDETLDDGIFISSLLIKLLDALKQ